MERWYRRAALLLWPLRRQYEILATGDWRGNVESLQAQVRAWQEASRSHEDSKREDLQRFASAIINRWPTYTRTYQGYRPAQSNKALLDCLTSIGDVKLIQAALTTVLASDIVGDEGAALAKICGAYGWIASSWTLSEETRAESIYRF